METCVFFVSSKEFEEKCAVIARDKEEAIDLAVEYWNQNVGLKDIGYIKYERCI